MSLIAKCGKTGFRSVQGLKGHERMCPKCRELTSVTSTKGASTQKAGKSECEHIFRLLTFAEKKRRNAQGETLADLGYDVVCTKCGELN